MIIRHGQQAGSLIYLGKQAYVHISGNGKWECPPATIDCLKKFDPHIILIQGLIYPFQRIQLKRMFPHAIMIAQHHGEKVPTGPSKYIYRMAAHFTDAYFFTAKDNAWPFIESRLIRKHESVYEVMEASSKINRASSSSLNGISGGKIFLWVGRLDQNKDPLTAIHAFALHLANYPASWLYMMYTTNQLEISIRKELEKNELLGKQVILLGSQPSSTMAEWYAMADVFISASHQEGSGYALLEALHCGCFPIVTAIPSFCKITREGEMGWLYPPGDQMALADLLDKVYRTGLPSQADIIEYADRFLSPVSIAKQVYAALQEIHGGLS